MLQRHHGQGATGQDDVRREREQFRSMFCAAVGIVLAPAGVDPHIAANSPAQFLQTLVERRKSILAFWIVRSPVHEHADAAHALALLPPRRERPRRRAAEQRDELAPLHSITSSALACNVSGTVRPSAFAVLRFMANKNFVGCRTGSSPGLAPWTI